jgi:hypothetical protein
MPWLGWRPVPRGARSHWEVAAAAPLLWTRRLERRCASRIREGNGAYRPRVKGRTRRSRTLRRWPSRHPRAFAAGSSPARACRAGSSGARPHAIRFAGPRGRSRRRQCCARAACARRPPTPPIRGARRSFCNPRFRCSSASPARSCSVYGSLTVTPRRFESLSPTLAPLNDRSMPQPQPSRAMWLNRCLNSTSTPLALPVPRDSSNWIDVVGLNAYSGATVKARCEPRRCHQVSTDHTWSSSSSAAAFDVIRNGRSFACTATGHAAAHKKAVSQRRVDTGSPGCRLTR